MRPRIILDPVFRRIDEILTPDTRRRLDEIAEVAVDDLESIINGDVPDRLQYLEHHNAPGLIQASRD